MMMILFTLSFLFFLKMFSLNQFINKTFIQNLYFFMSFIFMFNFMFQDKIWIKLSYILGLSFYSFSLIILSFWIFGLMIFSIENFTFFMKNCLILMNLLLMILIFSFSSLSLLLFYFFFEMSLIPTIMLIFIWGYSINRVSAFLYLLFYTLVFSLFFLILIFYLNNMIGSLLFIILENYNFKMSFLIYFFMISSFLVKMPLFLMHNWLLKAHIESPVYGSMFLAGLMLKLGSYGFLRVLLILLDLSVKYSLIFISISVIGMILISLFCICQIDMKLIVAYSSVVHMGILIVGMMTLMKMGFYGGFFMMIAHGMCSSGMFYLVNICYCRTGTRLLNLNKGMLTLMPSMSLFWFLLCSSNMSAPMSLNLISEIFLISSMYMWSKMSIFFLILICFFSFIYSLYLFSFIQHGNILKKKMFLFNSGKFNEFMNLMLHWLPLNFFILNLLVFVD